MRVQVVLATVVALSAHQEPLIQQKEMRPLPATAIALLVVVNYGKGNMRKQAKGYSEWRYGL